MHDFAKPLPPPLLITSVGQTARERMVAALRQVADLIEKGATHKSGGITVTGLLGGRISVISDIEIEPATEDGHA